MQQHIYYIKFALRFADMQIPELVTVFNAQVQSRGWSSMRAYHDLALLDEFLRRGIDITAVTDGRAISFAYPVRYDMSIGNNGLVTTYNYKPLYGVSAITAESGYTTRAGGIIIPRLNLNSIRSFIDCLSPSVDMVYQRGVG